MNWWFFWMRNQCLLLPICCTFLFKGLPYYIVHWWSQTINKHWVTIFISQSCISLDSTTGVSELFNHWQGLAMIECGPKKMEVAMYAGLKYISQEKNSQEQRGVRWNYEGLLCQDLQSATWFRSGITCLVRVLARLKEDSRLEISQWYESPKPTWCREGRLDPKYLQFFLLS